MGSNKKTTDFLKECMADALISLMSHKPFSKITVNEIALAAGVHRSTWFRNFSSKNEAITYKLIKLWNNWADEHNIEIRNQYTPDNALEFFQYNYHIQPILKKIYSANLQPQLYNSFYQIMKPQQRTNAKECYEFKFFSYGLFGLLDEWIQRGFLETPEEMTTLFFIIMGDKNVR